MLTAASRRLPGVRFERYAEALPEALPRMDVPAFVGFAACGPLHTPVMVNDAGQFQSIFGDAAPLAWDAQRGEFLRTRLAPAVQSFFANGGRRCWIVRVADDAAISNYFPLPGVLVMTPHAPMESSNWPDIPPRLFPAFARARSPGSWSDGLRISAGARLRPIQSTGGWSGGERLWLSAESPRPASGDLLRCAFGDDEYLLFSVVRGTSTPDPSPPVAGLVSVTLAQGVWFGRLDLPAVPDTGIETEARVFSTLIRVPGVAGEIAPTAPGLPHPFEKRVPAHIDASQLQPDAQGKGPSRITVDLFMAPHEAPIAGSLISLELQGQEAWLVVERIGLGVGQPSSPERTVEVGGRLWQRLPAPPATLPRLAQAGVVSIDLLVRESETASQAMGDLGLAPGHPRCCNALAADDAWFAAERSPLEFQRTRSGGAATDFRFPLAGAENGAAVFIPLGLSNGFEQVLPAVRQVASALERDGLANFNADLFIDAELIDTGVDQVMAQADFVRYLRSSPRPLKGMHSILGFGDSTIIDEVTIVAVPDAMHRPWHRVWPEPSAPARTLAPLARPQWWRSLPCDQTQVWPLVDEPPTHQFLDCDLRRIVPPTLDATMADGSGTIGLRWLAPEPGEYLLEECGNADFSDAVLIYRGTGESCTLYSRSPGDYFFRVRVELGRNGSDWSNVRVVRVGTSAVWQVAVAEAFVDDALRSVHYALLRMCAGRGDLLAVLALPAHYREEDALAHALQLRNVSASSGQARAARPLDPGEARALSHGALYHPWLIGRRRDGCLDEIPPEGAACGVLAQRAATRGAWVAPANEPLQGALAITAGAAPEQWRALQEAQVNVLRRSPRGLLILAEDTLSNEELLRPINVRRLLILLRRLILRRGATYVFEPLNDLLRRQVQRDFEETLFELFERGAFAGATPDAAYQVVTGAGVNTPQGLDDGRFVVEIRVAPSLPMTFLSLRLVHTGDRLTLAEGS